MNKLIQITNPGIKNIHGILIEIAHVYQPFFGCFSEKSNMMSKTAFILLCCVVHLIVGKVRMPLFSWDTVPVFIHMCNDSGPFNDTTLEYIATYPIVTIEKGQGINSNNTMPYNYSSQYEESKIEESCKNVKLINDSIICIFYYNSMLDWNMYYFHIQLLNEPNYWLKDDNGVVVRQSGDKSFPQPPNGMLVYDFREEDVIQFFIDKCINMTKSKWIDGCFVDRANQNLDSSQFNNYSFSDNDKTYFKNGHDYMLSKLTQTLMDNNQSIMISNNYVTPGVIATQIEGFYASEGSIKLLMGYVNQGLLVEAHAGYQTDGIDNHCQNIINSLSAFLIAAGEYSYYGCSQGWYIQPDWIVNHSEYHKPLGKPNGPATLNNGVYSRSFGIGTKVTFNTSNNVGTIEWSNGDISIGIEGSYI